MMGRVRILRYRVTVDHVSFHPLDRLLDVDRSEASAAVRRMVVDLAGRLSYREVAKVLTHLMGEPFTYQHVSRIVQNKRSPTR
jgi:hypothetical protein